MADKVKEGRVAARILADDVFRKAVDMAEESIITEWRNANDVEVRERAHAKLGALEEVLHQLRVLKERGEVEEDN